ncbi:DUF4150 domain-containing protein [Paracidovorax avenae]|uniref:DUF4150 domain-containing protein n=1 Tax=Paracidovorax avenae TaxID=80867 RepID=UPI00339780D7
MASESITAKDAKFKVIFLSPDVCLTPGKNGMPVPYPVMHTLDLSEQCSPNVFIAGKPAYLHNQSYVDKVKGDEPGTGKGVVSQSHMRISHDIDHSQSVFINGRACVRTGDMMWMNWPAPGGGSGGKSLPASGLGAKVDELIGKSPTLQQDLEHLQKDGWKIEYGKEGGGSFADRATKTITLDGNLQTDPNLATQTLSHEVGHANYGFQPDFSSKEAYVRGTLADEGAATMKNIEVQREVLANGGPNIGIAGDPANHAAYNTAYDQYLVDGNAAAARDNMGKVFGSGELTSTTKQPYANYYGDWYDQKISGSKK